MYFTEGNDSNMSEDAFARKAMAIDILRERGDDLTEENIQEIMDEIAEQEEYQKQNE